MEKNWPNLGSYIIDHISLADGPYEKITQKVAWRGPLGRDLDTVATRKTTTPEYRGGTFTIVIYEFMNIHQRNRGTGLASNVK